MIASTSSFLFDQPHLKPIPNEIQLVVTFNFTVPKSFTLNLVLFQMTVEGHRRLAKKADDCDSYSAANLHVPVSHVRGNSKQKL